MRVATLTAGYADGYPRHLSNRDAAVLVRGKRCALLGRVTMDLMMVDVTDVSAAEVGDEVVLLGRQGAKKSLSRRIRRARTDNHLGDYNAHCQPGASGIHVVYQSAFDPAAGNPPLLVLFARRIYHIFNR